MSGIKKEENRKTMVIKKITSGKVIKLNKDTKKYDATVQIVELVYAL